jgi:hypothetical protein
MEISEAMWNEVQVRSAIAFSFLPVLARGTGQAAVIAHTIETQRESLIAQLLPTHASDETIATVEREIDSFAKNLLENS